MFDELLACAIQSSRVMDFKVKALVSDPLQVNIERLDETKIELFDELLACVIQSSYDMYDTVNALASNPLHAARVNLMNKSLDSNKVLLSKVSINPSSN